MRHSFFKSSASFILAITALFASASAPVAHACATCGCSFNSDWESQGYSIQSGFKVDVIYNFINQTQLRSGTSSISPRSVPAGQELEDYTRNNYITLGLQYDFNADWGVEVQLPWVVRSHATFGEDHVSYDTSSTSSLGDIKLLARYQGFLPAHNLGFQFGIKLPTGSFSDTFRSGDALDRGLQPGTGTTDLIAGLYYFDKIGQNWSWFAQANVQVALDYRQDYKPGTAETISAGLRYAGLGRVMPQLQLNGRIANRDLGAQADTFDSGGTVLNISPGATVEVTSNLAAFIFVQVPVYQNLYGYQLAPRWTLTAGVRMTF